LCPFPNGLVLLPVASCRATAAAPRRTAGVLHPAQAPGRLGEFLQSRAKLLGVLLVEVDLVGGAVETKLDGLLGPATVNVVDELDFYLARHDRPLIRSRLIVQGIIARCGA
jgi:hypothetical protein